MIKKTIGVAVIYLFFGAALFYFGIPFLFLLAQIFDSGPG